MDPEERAREGVFLAFQYPVEIPGVNNAYFLKAALNAIAEAPRGSTSSTRWSSSTFVKRRLKLLAGRRADAAALGQRRASPAARRSATRSSRWRCSNRGSRSSTRPTRASTSTRCGSSPNGVNAHARPERAIIVVTHYQRLLNYIVPDFVHVLSRGPHREDLAASELALELEEKGYGWLEAAAVPASA